MMGRIGRQNCQLPELLSVQVDPKPSNLRWYSLLTYTNYTLIFFSFLFFILIHYAIYILFTYRRSYRRGKVLNDCLKYAGAFFIGQTIAGILVDTFAEADAKDEENSTGGNN